MYPTAHLQVKNQPQKIKHQGTSQNREGSLPRGVWSVCDVPGSGLRVFPTGEYV